MAANRLGLNPKYITLTSITLTAQSSRGRDEGLASQEQSETSFSAGSKLLSSFHPDLTCVGGSSGVVGGCRRPSAAVVVDGARTV